MATSISGTNITTDDELENESRLGSRKNSSQIGADDRERRESDTSSITNFTINKTTSDYQLNSKTSSRASGMNLPPLIPSTASGKSRRVPDAPSPPSMNVSEPKEKHGVRKLITRIFKSSSSTSKNSGIPRPTILDSPKSPGLNIDYARGTAYPPLSPLAVTQGPIRLLVLRHGERLDRYYSSQWLRQAFDKDGNFCRFSPILP